MIQSWVDKEEALNVGEVGRGVNVIRIHCTKFSKNSFLIAEVKTTEPKICLKINHK